MSEANPRADFSDIAGAWLCDDYCLTIRYLATKVGNERHLIDATLHLYPLPPAQTSDFHLEANSLLAGQVTFKRLPRAKTLQYLSEAADGQIQIRRSTITLGAEAKKHYYSEMWHRDQWFSELHLQISGAQLAAIRPDEASREDAMLRAGARPFDGVTDVASYLGLVDRRNTSQASTISIRVGSPADIDLGLTHVEEDRLHLTIRAHTKLDVTRVGLGVRVFPGKGGKGRFQAGEKIVWKRRASGGVRTGSATLRIENADSALLMLTLAQHTVRRQWFLDPVKATNKRLMATQLYDRDLKQLRMAVLDSAEPAKFENGVSAILFLLGFAPAVQLETQSPDIIAMTPAGTIVLIECTTKISDFHTKVGKLVDRQRSLARTLEASGQSIRVESYLVSSQPRDQIAADERALAQHGVSLLCREQLSTAFTQLRFPGDPDKLLEEGARRRAALLTANLG